MYKLLTILCVTGLTACQTCPPPPVPPVIVKTEIVKVKVPEEFLIIPAAVPDIDLKTSTQKQVATWLTLMNGRTDELIKSIKAIEKYNKD